MGTVCPWAAHFRLSEPPEATPRWVSRQREKVNLLLVPKGWKPKVGGAGDSVHVEAASQALAPPGIGGTNMKENSQWLTISPH